MRFSIVYPIFCIYGITGPLQNTFDCKVIDKHYYLIDPYVYFFTHLVTHLVHLPYLL